MLNYYNYQLSFTPNVCSKSTQHNRLNQNKTEGTIKNLILANRTKKMPQGSFLINERTERHSMFIYIAKKH